MVAVIVTWPGVVEYISTGHVTMHWSRAVSAALLIVLSGVLATTTFLLNMMELIQAQRTDRPSVSTPDRIRRA